MKYLHWNEKIVTDFSDRNVSDMYSCGYVFNRLGKGVMHQTRSLRIDLKKFRLSSENRRIIRKGESVVIEKSPIPYENYNWKIAKMAKSFYEKKVGSSFSANKIKELIASDQGFNTLLIFKEGNYSNEKVEKGEDKNGFANMNFTNNIPHGYAISYENPSMIHYSYPFYDLEQAPKDMGLIMMNKVIVDAKSRGLSYVYLGSLQRPTDTYKLQFEGLEWFDGKAWSDDIEKVKKILNQADK